MYACTSSEPEFLPKDCKGLISRLEYNRLSMLAKYGVGFCSNGWTCLEIDWMISKVSMKENQYNTLQES